MNVQEKTATTVSWLEYADLCAMVIDDSAQMRAIVRDLLDHTGVHRIIEADDGARALAMLRSPKVPKPHVIMCDLYMKGMGGTEFCNKVRRDPDPAIRDIPIIIMTGETDALVLGVVRQVGAATVLKKPLSAEALAAGLEAIVDS